jgi:hypothetical protein
MELPLLRRLLRVSLALMWLVLAIAGLFAVGSWASAFSVALDIPPLAPGIGLVIACLADFAIAILLLLRWKPRHLAWIQVALLGIYTIVATLIWPSLWAEALGPLVKNVPIAVAALVLSALEQER